MQTGCKLVELIQYNLFYMYVCVFGERERKREREREREN